MAPSMSKTSAGSTRPCWSSNRGSAASPCAGSGGRSWRWSSQWPRAVKYRPARPVEPDAADEPETDEAEAEIEEDEETAGRGKKTKVEWIEEIPPDRFYLRVGLGRKSSGSYYTPHSFVRFLVQETLGPQVEERSPDKDPKPLEILKLKVLDPAMGSGHFLVEACRFLGEKLYEACRLCDEKALDAERRSETAKTDDDRAAALEALQEWRQRIIDLPDPDDELAKTEFVPRVQENQALEPVTGYLPSKSLLPGTSTARAQALCRRLVATHCLYGVDKNPLAVELAKLALWLESHAEGMPLTFLDHRLVVGDSLTGPFWDRLLFRPGKPAEPVENLFSKGIYDKLQRALTEALVLVRRLEASIGSTLAELTDKEALKAKLDKALLPFRVAAAAWSGGVMLGSEKCDDLAYAQLLMAIGENGRVPMDIESEPLAAQIARGLGLDCVGRDRLAMEAAATAPQAAHALSYDLTFPEIFYPMGVPYGRKGFHAVLGNPPWEKLRVERRDVVAGLDPRFLEGREVAGVGDEHEIIERLFAESTIAQAYETGIESTKRACDELLFRPLDAGARKLRTVGIDTYHLFLLKSLELLKLAHGPTSRVHRPAGRALRGQPSVRAVEPLPTTLSVALTPSWRRAHDAAGAFPFVDSLFAATRRDGAAAHALGDSHPIGPAATAPDPPLPRSSAARRPADTPTAPDDDAWLPPRS